MKNSCSPLMRSGSGGVRIRPGKSVVSFSRKGMISDVWKMGKVCGACGRFNVTVEWTLLVDVMRYGPSKHGMNFATQSELSDLYSRLRLDVERRTRSPTRNGKVALRCLFRVCACSIFAVSRLSCASHSSGRICFSISSQKPYMVKFAK